MRVCVKRGATVATKSRATRIIHWLYVTPSGEIPSHCPTVTVTVTVAGTVTGTVAGTVSVSSVMAAAVTLSPSQRQQVEGSQHRHVGRRRAIRKGIYPLACSFAHGYFGAFVSAQCSVVLVRFALSSLSCSFFISFVCQSTQDD